MILRVVSAFYLLIVGICIGGIVLSALSASTIFNADGVLRDSGLSDLVITKYDSGIIMTNIFVKFNYILNISAVVILVYESLSFRLQNNGAFIWLLNVFNAILIFLFTFYYTTAIMDMQAQGAGIVGGIEFENIHSQSELVFKILLLTLSASFILRVVILSGVQKDKLKKAKPANKSNMGEIRKKTTKAANN